MVRIDDPIWGLKHYKDAIRQMPDGIFVIGIDGQQLQKTSSMPSYAAI